MKISKVNRDKIIADCKAYLAAMPKDKQDAFHLMLVKNPQRAMFWLKSRVNDDRNHDDNHPRFRPITLEITGEILPPHKRILAYDPDYQIYPDGSNDDHMNTVLKLAQREL